MFKNSDNYDLEAATETMAVKKLLLELHIQIESLKLILEKKGLITANDINAGTAYLKKQPEMKLVLNMIAVAEKKINEYKTDPQKHLQDLFNAKINGDIR